MIDIIAHERLPMHSRHTVILVDDGLATGATMKAAILAMCERGVARCVVAVPVAPVDTVDELRALADAVICLSVVSDFRGVGAYYGDFHQLSDAETGSLLSSAWRRQPP